MKTAVVLLNMGGPDGPEAVKPFRVNLFSDPAIIRAPIFVRFWLARLIAGRGEKAAAANYGLMGGKSPLLELTRMQAAALEARLDGEKCFVAMRYWHPFADETVREVKEWGAERVVLLPLYPQFSTTTSGSSIKDWREAAAKEGLAVRETAICCYFDDPDFVAAEVGLVREAVEKARAALPGVRVRVLFSAHGLPEAIVQKGDPYQMQVEGSVAAVMAQLEGVEHVVCYQSRATPQKWIAPSTVEEIERAGRDGVAVVVAPIAFVSDHIETLVELDVENAELAHKAGVRGYFRAKVPNADERFIGALAQLVKRAVADGLCSHKGARVCDAGRRDCPWTRFKNAA